MANVLVLANETIGGGELLDAVRNRHKRGGAHFYVVVPQSKPRHGNVIYDEDLGHAVTPSLLSRWRRPPAARRAHRP